MKKTAAAILLLLFVFPACSGVKSVTKKPWSNTENTIVLQDLTAQDFHLMDAGARLQTALEDNLPQAGFVLGGNNARYQLKYKVVNFDQGSRVGRIATFGISDSAKGKLKVKAALFDRGQMVGAWIVDSWISGGWTGGSEDELFKKAARKIAGHLQGDTAGF